MVWTPFAQPLSNLGWIETNSACDPDGGQHSAGDQLVNVGGRHLEQVRQFLDFEDNSPAFDILHKAHMSESSAALITGIGYSGKSQPYALE